MTRNQHASPTTDTTAHAGAGTVHTPSPEQRRAVLEKASRDAPTAIMRELAALAHERGYNAKSLADALVSRQFATMIHTSNVTRHLYSTRPHRSTIDEYAALLGMEPDHVAILTTGALPAPSVDLWEGELLCAIADAPAVFKEGTGRAVKRALALAHPQARATAVSAFALAMLRERSGIHVARRGWPGAGLAGFAETAVDLINLAALRRREIAGEDLLYRLSLALRSGDFSNEEISLIVWVAKAILSAKGINAQPMLEFIRHMNEEDKILLTAKRQIAHGKLWS